ncbi:hypothetical protein Hypma_000296 [Hypsizygus marmoreus]|uniref:Uncharacterized protein n=1 Tax=Hypsizygus marmoreus TaxID=39966 RepID=A0A369JCY6_HYPMA|nr:hypothetical protein Hypma_000296 [Hypsizygus marmoreus]
MTPLTISDLRPIAGTFTDFILPGSFIFKSILIVKMTFPTQAEHPLPSLWLSPMLAVDVSGVTLWIFQGHSSGAPQECYAVVIYFLADPTHTNVPPTMYEA